MKEGVDLIQAARELRRKMTPAEHLLWSRIRGQLLGCKFRRQVPIGPFIVDFVCMSHKLVVEVGGRQHHDSGQDRARDRWLRVQRYRVLRFWNEDVLSDLESVLATIARALETHR